jgi:acyl dehydratase
MVYQPRGKYFEEWKVGEEFETGRRTVTETDIVLFAGLSGDYNPLHTNEEFAKTTVFGTRVAHGFLVHSISVGLINQAGYHDGTVAAQKGHRNVVFTKGVVAGDTIFAKVRVAEINDKGNPNWGEVVYDVEVINQRDEVCSKSTRVLLLKKKTAAPK